jgi:hypothetical protein
MTARKKRGFLHHARHTFLPMKSNNHHPHILKSEVVFSVLALVLVFEVAVLAQGVLLFRSPNFMASVLPAVVADLTNTQRTDNSLQPLTADPLLAQAAQGKANDMAAKGYFSHVSPDGTLPWYWFKQVGYNYQFAGENLAINFNDSNDVVNAWMASPMHRANILKQEYTKEGIGIATGMYQGKSTVFVVQFFASQGAATTATAPKAPDTVATAISKTDKKALVVPVPTELMTTSKGSSSPTATTTRAQVVVNTGAPEVLGTETGAPVVVSYLLQPNFFQKLLASPFSTANVIFEVIAAFFVAVLISGIMFRKRLPRMTATIGGLLIIVVVLGFVLMNTHFLSSKVQVDQGSGLSTSGQNN